MSGLDIPLQSAIMIQLVGKHPEMRVTSEPGQVQLVDGDHQAQLLDLKKREAKLLQRIEEVEHTFRRKKAPLLDEMTQNKLEQQKIIIESSAWMHPREPHPGAECVEWVDSLWFSVICTIIICANGATMIVAYLDKDPIDASDYHLAEHVFLVWYTVELILKACLFQKSMLIGPASVVWLNWLDLLVVVSGALEQWIVPVVMLMLGGHGASPFSSLRILRFLRLLRIFRLLKIVKLFASYDLHWVEDQPFQMFMIGVIAVNSLTMGLELDIDWNVWIVVEEIFLVVYSFEIFVRLSYSKLKFFYNESWKWNTLDFIIVAAGVAESWITPLFQMMQSLFTGNPVASLRGRFGDFMKLFRLMRLLRVLRLVRLLRSIPPLFKLVSGIVEAAAGVQWVLLLALVMLYATAIVFCTVIGQGLLWEDHAPSAAGDVFGSVSSSMFELFKLMNDDQSVVDGVIDSPVVKILFVFFMIMSNWMVLAVLTSVVSDGMVHNTQANAEIEREQEFIASRARSSRRLKAMFKEIQSHTSHNRDSLKITEGQFDSMLADEVVLSEIIDAVGGERSKRELKEAFILCCGRDENDERVVDYVEFIDKLLNQDNAVVEKSLLRLESRERTMERTLAQVLTIVTRSSSLTEAELKMAQKEGIEHATKDESDLVALAHDHVRTDDWDRVAIQESESDFDARGTNHTSHSHHTNHSRHTTLHARISHKRSRRFDSDSF